MAGRTVVAIAVGLALGLGSVTPTWANAGQGITQGQANAVMFFAKKKPEAEPGPRLTPDAAEAKRTAIRNSVKSARDSGDLEGVADGLEKNAVQLGDPITMLEAAEARLEAAKKTRSVETAEASIETTRRALDILHFYSAVNNAQATSDWLVIEPGDASGLIDRGDGVVAEAEALIEEIEAEKSTAVATGPTDTGKKKRRRRAKGERKPGGGMLAGGSILTVIGVGGLGMVVAGTVISAAKQNEVEKFNDMQNDPEVDKLDDAGRQANLIAYIGAGVAVVGLATGLTLIILGAKKRKQGAAPGPTARTPRGLVLAPAFGPSGAGFSLRGRF